MRRSPGDSRCNSSTKDDGRSESAIRVRTAARPPHRYTEEPPLVSVRVGALRWRRQQEVEEGVVLDLRGKPRRSSFGSRTTAYKHTITQEEVSSQ